MTERRARDERRSDDRVDRLWFRQDVDELEDWVDVGEEHGPAGIAVMLALKGMAKIKDDEGRASNRWRTIARAAYLHGGPEEAKAIVATAVTYGLVEVLEDDGNWVAFRVKGWTTRQRQRARTSTERSRDWRRRQGTGREGTDERPQRPEGDERDDEPSRGTTTVTGTTTETSSGKTAASGRAAEAAALTAHGIDAPVEEFPDFAAVLAIAEDARRQNPSILVHDGALLSAVRAKPAAPHREAANLAAADLLSGRRSTRHFHVVFADRCRDLERGAPGRTTTAGAPRSSVDADVQRYLAQAEQYRREEQEAQP